MENFEHYPKGNIHDSDDSDDEIGVENVVFQKSTINRDFARIDELRKNEENQKKSEEIEEYQIKSEENQINDEENQRKNVEIEENQRKSVEIEENQIENEENQRNYEENKENQVEIEENRKKSEEIEENQIKSEEIEESPLKSVLLSEENQMKIGENQISEEIDKNFREIDENLVSFGEKLEENQKNSLIFSNSGKIGENLEENQENSVNSIFFLQTDKITKENPLLETAKFLEKSNETDSFLKRNVEAFGEHYMKDGDLKYKQNEKIKNQKNCFFCCC